MILNRATPLQATPPCAYVALFSTNFVGWIGAHAVLAPRRASSRKPLQPWSSRLAVRPRTKKSAKAWDLLLKSMPNGSKNLNRCATSLSIRLPSRKRRKARHYMRLSLMITMFWHRSGWKRKSFYKFSLKESNNYPIYRRKYSPCIISRTCVSRKSPRSSGLLNTVSARSTPRRFSHCAHTLAVCAIDEPRLIDADSPWFCNCFCFNNRRIHHRRRASAGAAAPVGIRGYLRHRDRRRNNCKPHECIEACSTQDEGGNERESRFQSGVS